MDEEEYDALTEEEKLVFNREIQQALWERKKRLESGAGSNRSNSLRSNFHGAHTMGSPSWRPGSSSKVAAMAPGDPGGCLAESRKTSCPSRVLVATALQGFPSSPLLPSLWGPSGTRGRTMQCNGGGTCGPSAILELPPAPPDNCPLGVAFLPLCSSVHPGATLFTWVWWLLPRTQPFLLLPWQPPWPLVVLSIP